MWKKERKRKKENGRRKDGEGERWEEKRGIGKIQCVKNGWRNDKRRKQYRRGRDEGREVRRERNNGGKTKQRGIEGEREKKEGTK